MTKYQYQHDHVINTFSDKHQHKAKFIVGWICTVSLWEGEMYYLRLLMNTTKSTSYKGMKTMYEQTFASFREACRRTGLLTDDIGWMNAFWEGFLLNFVTHTALFKIFSARYLLSDARYIYDKYLDIILQNLSIQRGGNNSAPHQTDQDIDLYVLSELKY